MEKKLIGEYLLAANKITDAQLQTALELQANSISGGKMPLLGTILVQMGTLSDRDLTTSLEEQEKDRREYNPAMFPPDVTQRK